MTPTLVWKRDTAQYSNGEILFCGKLRVGQAYFWGGVGRDDPLKYRAVSLLPSVRQPEERYKTLEEAKARVERITAFWFSQLEIAP